MVETEKMIEFEKTSTTTSTQSATVFSQGKQYQKNSWCCHAHRKATLFKKK